MAASLIGKLVDRTPTYPQSKRNIYHKMVRSLRAEITKSYPNRDDDIVMNLRDDIKIMQKELISYVGDS